MAKKESVTYEEIVRAIRAGQYSPVYYLMGEESYYIDKISDYIVDTALTEQERDFNLTVLYGPDTNVSEIITAARQYPMGAARQVVVVREAQRLDFNEENQARLILYLERPQSTTVLVFCHKHGALDKRKKVAAEIQRAGVLFESKKLYENQLPAFVVSYLRRKGLAMEQDAVMMLCSFTGSDLLLLSSELDKLMLALPEGRQRIDTAFVEEHVGVSKSFNNYELVSALVEKDVYKCNQIVKYFNDNPKSYSLQLTLSVLFNFFSNIMTAYYAPQRTEEGIAAWLELPKWQVAKNILPAMKKYSGIKVMQILEKLGQTDAKSKGVGETLASNGDLLKDLVYFILH